MIMVMMMMMVMMVVMMVMMRVMRVLMMMIMMMNEGQIETGLCQSHASYYEFKFYNSVPDLIIITFMLL